MAEVAALALICNILQVAEYAFKILSKGHEIRVSGKGVLPENAALEECAKQLFDKNKALQQSLDENADIPPETRDDDERALVSLARDCNEEARRLVEKLRSISMAGNSSKIGSIRSALKAVWSKDEINSVARRMEGYQKSIDSRLIQSISLQQKIMKAQQSDEYERLLSQGIEVSTLIKQMQQLLHSNHTQQGSQFQTLVTIMTSHYEDIIARLPNRDIESVEKPPSYEQYSGENKDDILELVRRNQTDKVKSLVTQKPALAIQTLDSSDRTALHVASTSGNLDVLKALIRKGANINAQDEDASTPLHLAVKANSPRCVRHLLFCGANKDVRDDSMKTPLDYAVSIGEMNWILKYGYDLETQNENGETALMYFIKASTSHAHSQIIRDIRSLLAQGARPDGQNNGITPLVAAADCGNVEVITLLLEAGAGVNERSERLDTPLSCAALHGHIGVVKKLLEQEPNPLSPNRNIPIIDSQNTLGFTALHEACSHAHDDIACLLVEKGANLELVNGDGNCAIHLAAKIGCIKAVEAMITRNRLYLNIRTTWSWTPLAEACDKGQPGVARLLLDHHADVDLSVLNEMRTPLILAAISGNRAVIPLLIGKGCDLEARDFLSFTPLIHAVRGRRAEIVRELLTLGADANNPELVRGCWAPLTWAVWANDRTSLLYLVESGRADINQRNGLTGITALMESVRQNNLDIVSDLLAYGADPNITDIDPHLDRGKHYPPIVWAAREAYHSGIKMLQLLTEKGKADLSAANVNGWTALHEASRTGPLDAVKYLLSKGADRYAKNMEDDHERPASQTPLDIAKLQAGKRDNWAQYISVLENDYLK